MSGSKSSNRDWAPGQVWSTEESIHGLEEHDVHLVLVKNTGDRPIQVGSHFHFFEVNKALDFPRVKAWGRRLAIAAGTAIRFEPGMELEVPLIDYGGERIVYGFQGLVSGSLEDPAVKSRALMDAKAKGYKGV